MIKVLIADDQELIRESLKIVLNTHEDLQVIDTVNFIKVLIRQDSIKVNNMLCLMK